MGTGGEAARAVIEDFEAALRRGLDLLFQRRSDAWWGQNEAILRTISEQDRIKVAAEMKERRAARGAK